MDIKLPGGAPDPGGGEPAIQRTNPGAADERLRKTGCAADARYKKAACRGEGGTQVRLLVKYGIDCQSAEQGTEAVFGLAGKTRSDKLQGREARPRTPTPRRVEWRTGAPSDEAPLAAFPQAVSRKQTCFQSPLIEPCMKFSLTRLSDRFRRSVFSPIFKSSLRHFLSWLRPRRLPLFLLRWLSCHHNTVLLLLRIVP